MKCLQSPSGEISRVSNAKAEALVKEGWQYVSKSVYKRRGLPMPMPTDPRMRTEFTVHGTITGRFRRV